MREDSRPTPTAAATARRARRSPAKVTLPLEDLRQRDEQYRAIFEGSLDGLFLWDEHLRLVDVNPAGSAMYGHSREELVGRTYPPTMPGQYVKQRLDMVRRALAGETTHIEDFVLRPDGTRFEADLRVMPFTQRGRPHALAVMRDISDRRVRERELQRSEARLRATIEAAFDAVMGMDAQGHVVEFNPAAERIFGHRREDVMGRLLPDLMLPEYRRAAYEREMEALRTTGEGTVTGRLVEMTLLHADGHEIPVEVGMSVAVVPEGRIFMGHVRDITERQRAEAALRDSEEQYRAIFNASIDALVLRDASFRIVDVNATYEVMSGYSRAEVLGVDRILANPPQVHRTIRDLHARALAGETVRMETELRRRDGKRFDLELRAVRIQHRGQPHVLYMGRDITERHSAEQRRRELERQLRQVQKMEAIGQLTGGIAHDFNNILTSVIGYITMSEERPAVAADPVLARQLGQARLAAERARDHVAQLLAFSRPRRGERRLVWALPVAQQALQLLRPNLPSSIAVGCPQTVEAAEAAVPPVVADPVQLEQVLFNLCINARDAIEDHGRIGVRIGHSQQSGHCASCGAPLAGGCWVWVEVADDGRGMTPDVIERMFEPFFTTKEVGRGTGMGLAMVHGIVHDHDGHVQVESVPGEGSVMRILLPPASEDTALEHPEHAGPAEARPAAPLHGRVLLVEDEQIVGDYMVDLMSSWGMEVVLERDPASAARRLESSAPRFDAMVTDQTMPRMTGLELARHAHRHRPGLPVLVYTGNASGITPEELADARISRLLRKPIEPHALRAMLGELLAGRAGG